MKKLLLIISITTFSFRLSHAQIEALSFQWADQMLENNYDQSSRAICVDALGNVYTTGSFNGGVDFDPGPGVNVISPSGSPDVFISKLDATGNFVWVKRIGGEGGADAYSISLDNTGNILITGSFAGTIDFDPGLGSFSVTSSGTQTQPTADAFILKLDVNGNFNWVKSFGGKYREFCLSHKTDVLRNVYAMGTFQDTVDFDPGPSQYNLITKGIAIGYSNPFILKLDSLGNFIWAKQFEGGSSPISFYLDDSCHTYISGSFEETIDLDTGPGSYTLAPTTTYYADAYIAKLDSTGNFLWGKQLKSTNYTFPNSIAIDSNGDVLTCGMFWGTTDFDPSPATYTLTSPFNAYNMFISKLDALGNFMWVKQLGSGLPYNSHANIIKLDAGGRIYMSGAFEGVCDFDPSPSSYTLTSSGYEDIFISKFDSLGNFILAERIGGTYRDYVSDICLDAAGNIHATGGFESTTDFNPGPGIYNLTASTLNYDIFVCKFGQSFVGINEITSKNSLSIFPNPTSGQFNLKFDQPKQKTEIKIYNSLGQLILQKNISSTDKISLSISDQPSGIYFVEVTADRESYRAKVVKE